MNLDKHRDYFDPTLIDTRIQILGCGAVGSTVAEMLVRLGLSKLTLWDPAAVKPHNIANQMFWNTHVGQSKATSLAQILTTINPDIKGDLKVHSCAYIDQQLSGWLFINIDNVDVVRELVKIQRYNPLVKGFIDFRLGLMDGQHYAALTSVEGDVDRLLATMDFTHEEAVKNSPVSACGTSLSVVPGVRLIISLGVANFMNILMKKPYQHMILSNASTSIIDAF